MSCEDGCRCEVLLDMVLNYAAQLAVNCRWMLFRLKGSYNVGSVSVELRSTNCDLLRTTKVGSTGGKIFEVVS